MKSELLIQMDGLVTQHAGGSVNGGDPPQVFVLGASNLPGDLDSALLRRLPKRIMVPLPDGHARLSMLTALLGPRVEAGAESSLQALAAATEGFSGV
jgi:SpoVK/Ycf46/Vps4 family AAA+-type ATPase